MANYNIANKSAIDALITKIKATNTDVSSLTDEKVNSSDLATVATSGSYNDLSDTPESMKNPNSLTLTMNGSSIEYDGSEEVSKTWYAPAYGAPQGYELVSDGDNLAPVWRSPLFAICNTDAATAAKTATITNFKLTTNIIVAIQFTNEHTGSEAPTLNINDSGAKTMYWYDQGGITKISSELSSWDAGDILLCRYTGLCWYIIARYTNSKDYSYFFDSTEYRGIAEIASDIGKISTLTTSATDLVSAINEVNANTHDYFFDSSFFATISEIAGVTGDPIDLTTDTKTNLVDAINEVNEKAHTHSNKTVLDSITETDVSEWQGYADEIIQTNNNIGTLSDLSTTTKTNLVSAINEVANSQSTVDTELSETSENPVQNKVITAAMQEKLDYKTISEDDLDDTFEYGTYYVSASSGNKLPYYEDSFMLVWRDDVYTVQTVLSGYPDYKTYIRNNDTTDSGTWSDWNIVGFKGSAEFDIIPTQDDKYDLGSQTKQWNSVWSTYVNATTVTADELELGTTSLSIDTYNQGRDTYVICDTAQSTAAKEGTSTYSDFTLTNEMHFTVCFTQGLAENTSTPTLSLNRDTAYPITVDGTNYYTGSVPEGGILELVYYNESFIVVNPNSSTTENAVSYSTTPVQIGTWIDGRPVWRMAWQKAFADMTTNDFDLLVSDKSVTLPITSQNQNKMFVLEARSWIYFTSPCIVDDIPTTFETGGYFAMSETAANLITQEYDGYYGYAIFVGEESEWTVA